MDLREARLQQEMTQVELAGAINSTPVSVSNYEHGKTIPREVVKRRIEQILGPIDWPTERIQHLRVPTLYK